VVHDGCQTVDAAVRRVWGGRALVAHCPRCVEAEVLGHLAEKDRPRVRQALRAAWSLKGGPRAARLAAVAEELARQSPGAGARLHRSVQPLCAVAALGLPARLAAHVQGLGPIRELAEAAREAAGAGAAAIASVLPQWLPRMRRRIGAESLPVLAERLAARAGAAR
jgi:hypothetical protein